MKERGLKKTLHVSNYNALCGSVFARVLFLEFAAIFAKYNPCKISQKFTSAKFDVRKISVKNISKIKMDGKKLRMVLVISHVFPSLKNITPIRLSMFSMLCDRQRICVKFCELFICEIKSAWKFVRKREGRVYLVLKSRSM